MSRLLQIRQLEATGQIDFQIKSQVGHSYIFKTIFMVKRKIIIAEKNKKLATK